MKEQCVYQHVRELSFSKLATGVEEVLEGYRTCRLWKDTKLLLRYQTIGQKFKKYGGL